MNLKFQHRKQVLSPDLKELIEKRSRKIEKVLPTFSSHDLDLHVAIEKLPHKKQCRTVLVLTTPQSALRAEDIEDNSKTSVLRAFDELFRRVEKFKSQLNREKSWRRHLAASSTGPAAESPRELKERVNQNLPAIENYIRHELFHEAIAENLPSGFIEPEAVVDEVFLEILSRTAKKPTDLSFRQWLFQVARRKLTNRLREFQMAQKESHLEELVRISSPWEDEMLNFYQPDERLRLEDILADDRSDNPEQAMEREETEKQLRQAIAHLPKPTRECFILSALQGFEPDEVAMIMGTTRATVLERVKEARKQLRRPVAER